MHTNVSVFLARNLAFRAGREPTWFQSRETFWLPTTPCSASTWSGASEAATPYRVRVCTQPPWQNLGAATLAVGFPILKVHAVLLVSQFSGCNIPAHVGIFRHTDALLAYVLLSGSSNFSCSPLQISIRTSTFVDVEFRDKSRPAPCQKGCGR